MKIAPPVSVMQRWNLLPHAPKILSANIDFFEQALEQEHSRTLCFYRSNNYLPLYVCLLLGLHFLMKDTQTAEEIISTLTPGHSVIYNASRGIFEGLDDNGNAIVVTGGVKCTIPQSVFFKIKPYYGKETVAKIKGLSRKPAYKRGIISSTLGIAAEDIPTEVSCSIVIVANRGLARSIVDHPIRSEVKVCEIFPAAFYTENDEYHYRGNESQAEPLLKFTNSISMARNLVLDDIEKRTVGLVVCGNREIETGLSELEFFLSRKSLPHVWVLDHIGGWNAANFIENNPDLDVFAWTNRALANHGHKEEFNTSVKLVPSYIAMSDFDESSLRKTLAQLSRSEYGKYEKIEQFIVTAYTLLRIMTCAIFPLKHLERPDMLTLTVGERLKQLQLTAYEYDGEIGSVLNHVSNKLILMHKALYDKNDKYNQMLDLLMALECNEETRVSVIIPKKLFESCFRAEFQESGYGQADNVSFYTPGQYSLEKDFGTIIVTGAYIRRDFNPFEILSDSHVYLLSYDYESSAVSSLESKAERKLNVYDKKNLALTTTARQRLDDADKEASSVEYDAEIEDYMRKILVQRATSMISLSEATGSSSIVSVYRIATFDSGETAFFTRHYTAYCLDIDNENVIEKNVDDLLSGDYIVFTSNNEEAKDIVDNILEALLQSNKSPQEFEDYYNYSKKWKQALQLHIDENSLSYIDVSKELKMLGNPKHPFTIRAWLNEDSYIVGPRELESYEAIAKLTGDSEMLNNPEVFRKACDYIRKLRVRVLKHIGISIVKSFGYKQRKTDEWLESVVGDVSDLARVVQVEAIVEPLEDITITVGQANRLHG